MESNRVGVTFATEGESAVSEEAQSEALHLSPPSADVILEVLHLPNKSLRQPSTEFTKIDVVVYKKFVDLMIKTMYEANGIGLAAPQVGLNKQLIVIDPMWMKGTSERNPQILLNPSIVETYGKQKSTEGCLSVLGLACEVERYEEVVVSWDELDGTSHGASFHGLHAIVIQHEIDHLDGKLILDHMSKLRQDVYKRKLNKFMRKQA